MPRGVKFHEEDKGSVLYGRFERGRKTPPLVRWAIKSGIAKDKKTATYILLGVAAVAAALAFYLFTSVTGGAETPPLDPSDPAFQA